MSNARPPFRADHVGSFLRSPAWKDAHAKHDQRSIDDAELRRVEDHEIERIIKKQEEIGLALATDGEYRRAVWSNDFFKHLDGCEGYLAERGVQFHGIESTRKSFRLTGRVGFSGTHPALDHFRFLKAHTRVMPKMTIPSPTVAHYRRGPDAYKGIYPDLDAFLYDLTEAYCRAVGAFYDAGCRYLQLDDTSFAHLGSKEEREGVRRRGEDPDHLVELYARMLSRVLAVRPADMTITTHLCHGNHRSSWSSEGDYEAIAETLLATLDYDGYFLEYDTDRVGGFEPLRFVPKGRKQVVLGLVTSKSGALESKDAIKHRIDAATRYVDIGQLCLSPQCGFASTEEGNTLDEEAQWAKLRLVVDIADEVWGNR